MQTFTYQPDYEATLSREPQVTAVGFGDGYEQRRPKGLNHNLRRYSLTFSGTEARIKAIDTFLTQRGGYQAFLWTPYGSGQGKFKCKQHQITLKTGFWQLSAEFEEVVR